MKTTQLSALLILGKRGFLMCIGVFFGFWGTFAGLSAADTVKAQAAGIEGVWVPYPEHDPDLDFTPDQAFIFTQSEFKIKDTETDAPPLVFRYHLQGENLVLDFQAPPGWDKEKKGSMYATVDFNEWRQSKAKRKGNYLFLQFGPQPNSPMMRMRRYEKIIPGL